MSKKHQKHRTPRAAMRFSVRMLGADGGWKMIARFVYGSDAQAVAGYLTRKTAYSGVTLGIFYQNKRQEVLKPDGVCTRTELRAEAQQHSEPADPCKHGPGPCEGQADTESHADNADAPIPSN